MSFSESELSDSDAELQDAFSKGKLKPGLNKLVEAPKQFVNNVVSKYSIKNVEEMDDGSTKNNEELAEEQEIKMGLKQKVEEMKLNLPWIERLDCVNDQAPLAPEIAAQISTQEERRETQMKNNKKLPQFAPSEDPVLNDFKREMLFYRRAQAAVSEAIPKLKGLGLLTKRPDDYFAEMAKTDEHMQKIREHLMKKQEQQKRSERVKQLRQQRKEGKMVQIQTKLQRQEEKKEMLNQVKKVRKGMSKDLDFLDGKKNKSIGRKSMEKRKMKDKKFGFGGKKSGMKSNTKDSAADISEFRNPGKSGKKFPKGNSKHGNKNRPGKNRRVKIKARGKK